MKEMTLAEWWYSTMDDNVLPPESYTDYEG